MADKAVNERRFLFYDLYISSYTRIRVRIGLKLKKGHWHHLSVSKHKSKDFSHSCQTMRRNMPLSLFKHYFFSSGKIKFYIPTYFILGLN